MPCDRFANGFDVRLTIIVAKSKNVPQQAFGCSALFAKFICLRDIVLFTEAPPRSFLATLPEGG